mgnify:FL=1
MRGLIITGGNIRDEFACEKIKTGGYDMIMAADSGMDFLYRNHLTPDIIVGDFDSVDHDALDFFREDKRIEFCRLDPVKDDTDTEYAIRDALSRGITQLTILGGTGSRLDHVLGNISLLGIGLEENVEIELVDEHNRVRMIDKPLSIRRDEQFGRFVSLIPYTGNVEHVTLTGFKYTLDNYTMGGFNSLGVSNEIKEEVARIEFSSGILLVIESVD